MLAPRARHLPVCADADRPLGRVLPTADELARALLPAAGGVGWIVVRETRFEAVLS